MTDGWAWAVIALAGTVALAWVYIVESGARASAIPQPPRNDEPEQWPAEDLLTMRYHVRSDGWEIINGRGEILGLTMISPSHLIADAPGKGWTDRLRYLMTTGQYAPADPTRKCDPRTDWEGWKRERGILPLVETPVTNAVCRDILSANPRPEVWFVDADTLKAIRRECRELRGREKRPPLREGWDAIVSLCGVTLAVSDASPSP